MIVFLLIITLSSCERLTKRSEVGKVKIARVYDKILYNSDVEPLLKNASDSLSQLNLLTENWVKEQLMVQKALEHLPIEQTDIEQQVEDYRLSLLLYIYERELVQQNLDTTISNQEMIEFYESNKQNFVLGQDMVHFQMLKIDKSIPQIDSARFYFKSEGEEYQDLLKDYLIQYSIDFKLSGEWDTFENLRSNTPIKADSPSKLVKNDPFLDLEDEQFVYLIKIIEFGLKNELAPLSFKQQDIKEIIVQKRKLEYIRSINNKILRDAIDNNEVQYYN